MSDKAEFVKSSANSRLSRVRSSPTGSDVNNKHSISNSSGQSRSSGSGGSGRSSKSSGSSGSGDDNADEGSITDQRSVVNRRSSWSNYSWNSHSDQCHSDGSVDAKVLPSKSSDSERQQNSVSYHNGIVPMARPSLVSKHLGCSSGSEEDLTMGARRVMRQRKNEQQHMRMLGPLVPIINEEPQSSSGSQHAPVLKVTRLWVAVPLRTKRAETELIHNNSQPKLIMNEFIEERLRKSSMACPVRHSKVFDVSFGNVEVLDFSEEAEESARCLAQSEESVVTEESEVTEESVLTVHDSVPD